MRRDMPGASKFPPLRGKMLARTMRKNAEARQERIQQFADIALHLAFIFMVIILLVCSLTFYLLV